MSTITDELRCAQGDLQAATSALIASLDLARLQGIAPMHLDEIQDAIDNSNSVCIDLGGTIRGIELGTAPPL